MKFSFRSCPVVVAVALAAACLLTVFSEEGVALKETSVKPGINESFLAIDLKVGEWLTKFEVESREVYHCREEIVKALELKPGMAVADVGAGTGLYLQPFADVVGETGKLYAVDISEGFIKHLGERVEKHGLKQAAVVKCKEDSVELPEACVDLVFVCDTYHHFEYPMSTLASIHKALKPGGRIVVIDFERIPGKSREWLLGHVRAGKEVFTEEIETAGFEKVKEVTIQGFEENYFLMFRKS